MKNFDYIILSEYNEWLGTGKQETQEQLQAELDRLKSEDKSRELVVFKAETMQSFYY